MNIADIFAAVHLNLDGTGFEAQATALASKSGVSAGTQMSKSLNDSLKKAGTGMLLGAGMQAFSQAEQMVTNLIGGSAEAYRVNQASLALLTQALANNVKGWDGDTTAVEDNIQKNIQYGFTVAEQRDSMGKLVGVTKDVGLAMQVETAAMDVSRLKHVDLTTATTAMVMAMGGNLRGLKAIGVQLKAGATQQEVLTAVMKIAGGQMEIYANTDAGKMAAAQERVNEDMVKLGGAISTVTTDALPYLVEGLNAVVDALGLMAQNANVVIPLAGLFVAAWVSGLGTLTAGFATSLLAGIKGSALVAVPAATTEGAAIGEAVVAGETGAVIAGAPVVAGGVAAAGGEAIVAGGAIGTAVGGAIGVAAALALPILIVGAIASLAPAVQDALAKYLPIHDWIFGADSKGWDIGIPAEGLPWPLGPKGTPDLSIGPMEHVLGGDSIPKAAKNVADKVTKSVELSALDIKLIAAGIPQTIVDQLDAGGTTLEMGADGAFKAVPIALTDAELATEAIAAGAPQAIADQIAAGAGTLSVAADGTFSVIPKAATSNMAAANTDVRVGLAEIISQVKAFGVLMASAWSGAESATVSAQTIGYRLESNAADIADNAKAIADKASWSKLTQQQKDALLIQRSQLQADHIALLVEDTQYGTAVQREAKMTSLLTSKELHDGLSDSNPDIASMWADVQGKTETDLFIIQHDVEAWAKLTSQNIAAAFGDKSIDQAIIDAAAHWVTLLPVGMEFIWTMGHPTGTQTPGGPTPPATGSESGPPGQQPLPAPSGKIIPQQGYPGGTSFAVGTPFVAYDQLAYVHRGEAVIPAAQNKAGLGGITIASGAITITGVGNDVSLGAAKRFGQTILDEVAKGLQANGSRYSEFSGSRP
jgi:hypothetical protein